jgi:hypothetical protein
VREGYWQQEKVAGIVTKNDRARRIDPPFGRDRAGERKRAKSKPAPFNTKGAAPALRISPYLSDRSKRDSSLRKHSRPSKLRVKKTNGKKKRWLASLGMTTRR